MLCIWCHATTSANHADTCPASLNRNTNPQELEGRARDLWWKLTGSLSTTSAAQAPQELAVALETAVTQHALSNGLAAQIERLRADLSAARTYRAPRPPVGLPGFDDPIGAPSTASSMPDYFADDAAEDRVHLEVTDAAGGSLTVEIDLADVDPARAVQVTVDGEAVFYDPGHGAAPKP